MDLSGQQVEAWVSQVASPAKVFFGSPAEMAGNEGVNLYLLEIFPDPTARSVREAPPLKLLLRYLVTAWAGSPRKMHELLGTLMFAALQKPEYVVEPEPVAVEIWRSLGVPVRPSMVLRVPVLQPRPVKPAPKVRQPIVLKASPMRPLFGRVLGPGDVAIMGALVELPALNLATRTDPDGRFHFAAVPTQPPVTHLRVHAKGREVNVAPERSPALDQPLIIHLKESEL